MSFKMKILSKLSIAFIVFAVMGFESGCSQKPELPVKLLVRQSLVGEGNVVQFHNEDNRRFVLTVCIENRAGTEKAERVLPIGPGEMKEMGWLEGWKFAAGDKITVNHDKYRSLTIMIP